MAAMPARSRLLSRSGVACLGALARFCALAVTGQRAIAGLQAGDSHPVSPRLPLHLGARPPSPRSGEPPPRAAVPVERSRAHATPARALLQAAGSPRATPPE